MMEKREYSHSTEKWAAVVDKKREVVVSKEKRTEFEDIAKRVFPIGEGCCKHERKMIEDLRRFRVKKLIREYLNESGRT